MARLNQPGARARVSGPVTGPAQPAGRTYEGAPGFARDLKSELFLLATTTLWGEKTFYEGVDERATRFKDLVHRAALDDPTWTYGLLTWLRGPGNLRTVAIVGACEFVKARLDAGPAKTSASAWNDRRHDANEVGMNRSIIDRVCQRADEPGEVVAYWASQYGRRLPMAVKRGVADATKRLTNERAVLKYDTASHGYRLGDVIDLTHPRAKAPWQGQLYGHALDRRHGREIDMIALHKETDLDMIFADHTLRTMVNVQGNREALLDPHNLKAAGFTWEDALSLGGSGLDKKRLWEALIEADALGYMALLRNLRNLDEAGVSDALAQRVAAKLVDPEQVRRSRQLPLRFLSAFREAPSLRWAWPLEQALDLSLQNVPQLDGNTLVLVDTSGSMSAPLSSRSRLQRWDAAALFGIALARKCGAAEVVSYAGGWGSRQTKAFDLREGASLLASLNRWESQGYFLNGGTDTAGAVRHHLKPHHSRLVILTDEQSHTGVEHAVPSHVKFHTINLAGYRYGHAPASGENRWTFGGLTDNVFHTMMHVERAQDARWPWEHAA